MRQKFDQSAEQEQIIAEALRRELDSVTPPPPEQLWQRISPYLGPIVRRRRFSSSWRRAATVVAVLVLVAGIAGLYRSSRLTFGCWNSADRDRAEKAGCLLITAEAEPGDDREMQLYGDRAVAGKESVVVKSVIEMFFELQYNAYLDLEYRDLTPVLDVNQIQNQNKVTALKNLLLQCKYMDGHDYVYIGKNRFPYTAIYSDVAVGNDQAMVVVELELEPGNAYPPFMASGRQLFELEKQGGKWKITNHVYEGLNEFEYSTSEPIPELTFEQIASEIDKEFLSD